MHIPLDQPVELTLWGLPAKDGNVVTIHATKDNIPLFIYDSKNKTWQGLVTPGKIGDQIGLRIGSFYGGSNKPTSQDLRNITQIITRDYNIGGVYIGTANAQPVEGKFDFSGMNWTLDQAKSSQHPVYVHPIIWNFDAPDWMRGKSRDELIAVIKTHVTTVITELNRRMQEKGIAGPAIIDVVNEAGTPGDFYLERIGPDYVDIAFEAAHAVYPEAILIYNDYDNHTKDGQRYQNTLKIVNQLKKKGLIQAVGVEMVIRADSVPAESAIAEAMKSYGLPVVISESIIDLRNIAGSQELRLLVQKEIQRRIVRAAVESGVVTTFIAFQVGDKFSVYQDPTFQYSAPNANPTLYDDSLNPKPAFFGLMQGVFEAWISRTPGSK